MTAETDRAAALKAAIQDIARDLEADLGKLTRYRGTSTPSSSGVSFKDPGADVAEYASQKSAGSALMILRGYRAITRGAFEALAGHADSWGVGGGVPVTGASRAQLVELIDAIEAIRNHDDAVALVGTFEEN